MSRKISSGTSSRFKIIVCAIITFLTIIFLKNVSSSLNGYIKNAGDNDFITTVKIPVNNGTAESKESIIVLDNDNICPQSLAINAANNHTPPQALIPHDELLHIVKYWHDFNCPQQKTCQFGSIGQHLLHIAMKRNQTLLTVQVGAMDGYSNDPMYHMFFETKGKNYVQAREGGEKEVLTFLI